MTSIPPLPECLLSIHCKQLFVLELDITAVQDLGSECVVGIVGGGRFAGPRLSGRVLAGGSDWQRVMPGGTVRLDCRIILETAEGELIAMTYQGVRSGPAEVLERLAQGAAVRAEEYYLRINPLFKTQSITHASLNRLISVGAGQRLANGPIYNVFEIL